MVESQHIQVGPMDRWSVHVAELIGIYHAVGTVFKMAHQQPTPEGRQTATIFCDSRSALQAIKSARNKSGQRIVHAIHQAATEVQTAEIALRLQWVPGHCDNHGNEAADLMAKHAASPCKPHLFRPLLTNERVFIQGNIVDQWEQKWRTSSNGDRLQNIDDTLPATHHHKFWDSALDAASYMSLGSFSLVRFHPVEYAKRLSNAE